MKGEVVVKSIRIQNVRSLKDTNDIQMLPINILVGQNSSGKSTFLRMLPLLKQSFNKRTDGPLLWAGDVDDYVDFGSFHETVTNDGSDSIVISFGIPTSAFTETSLSYFYNREAIDQINGFLSEKDTLTYSITIQKRKNQKRERLLSARIISKMHKVEIKGIKTNAIAEKVLIDGREVIEKQPTKENEESEIDMYYNIRYIRYSELFNYILPSINKKIFGLFESIKQWYLKEDNHGKIKAQEYSHLGVQSAFNTALDIFGACLCYNIPIETIRQRQTGKTSLGKEEVGWFLRLSDYMQNAPQHDVIDLKDLSVLSFSFSILGAIESFIKSYFNQVHYIAPLRATAERYYRLRNLSLSEVDYQGKNLAMFLNGLSPIRMKSFQEWTDELFGFHALVKESGGHVSVGISRANTNQSVNLSDTGFGYSQILPIITQLWDLATRERQNRASSAPLVIAIEQPELHLHPALQYKLAKAFVAAIDLAKKHHYQLQLILETHSETIVNYFGRAIENNVIPKENVQVLMFERDQETMYTTVRRSEFDNDGYLSNWPIGFFAPKE